MAEWRALPHIPSAELAAHALDGAGTVGMGMVPIESGGMILRQLEHVVEGFPRHDVNHRRLRIGGSQRLEQVWRHVESMHVRYSACAMSMMRPCMG